MITDQKTYELCVPTVIEWLVTDVKTQARYNGIVGGKMGKNAQKRRLHVVEKTGGVMEYKIPEKAREKLFTAFQQRELVIQQFDAALQLAFDSMGVEGRIVGVDLAAGIVRTEDAPAPAPEPEELKEG